MGLSLAILAGLIADAVFGEPRVGHPLVIFGRLADRIERAWNNDTVAAGGKALALVVGGPVLVVAWLVASLPSALAWAAVAGLLMLAIGRASLAVHARPVAAALARDDLPAARRAIGALVSRETEAMDAPAIRRAAIESVLENASDAIVASLVWAAIGAWLAGPVGAAVAVVAHRLINTLDAMWGYRNTRYRYFGTWAARLDDLANWPAARVTALAFVVVGDRRRALACWRTQAGRHDSPNAGPVMAAGAGALGVRLGGAARYHGVWRERPVLGDGPEPGPGDIERALGLVDRALAGVVAVILLLALL